MNQEVETDQIDRHENQIHVETNISRFRRHHHLYLSGAVPGVTVHLQIYRLACPCMTIMDDLDADINPAFLRDHHLELTRLCEVMIVNEIVTAGRLQTEIFVIATSIEVFRHPENCEIGTAIEIGD